MNKKFFTLLAASCAAMAVNAQTIYYGTDGKVTAQVTLNDAASTVIANAGAEDARYPYSPFGSNEVPSVAITKLENVGKGAEAKYFQLMTGVNGTNYLLAMQWNAPLGKYQLVLINPEKTSSSYFIEETLWQVTASEVGASKDLRYVFVNKGAQLPLQAATSDPQLDYTTVEGAVITWSWSDVADTKTATSLEGKLIAALDKQYSVVLNYDETDDDGSIIAVKVDRAKVGTTGTDKDAWDAVLEFSAYEANPIALNADQINAMMTGTGIKAPVQFNMNPTVTPSSVVNPLTAGKFKAFDTKIAKDDDQKDANGKKIDDFITMNAQDKTDGYVVLAKGNNLKNMLRVDTLYHNTDPDAIYELKLTTDEFTAPREAYVLGKKLNDAGAALYKSSDYLATAVTIMAKEQAKFRFRYYPSDNSVLV
ncbi:MAG: hypothetical protein LUD46_02170 [Parabacteroides sp.]|nr:hypothetical protein [Parabacteroides sp.]